MRVGHYNLSTTLGSGTFGTVKLARHEETGLEYAVKVIDKTKILANKLTRNVRREIAIMKVLNHPNIVHLHEILSSGSALYMVMDLMRGGELFHKIEQSGSLDMKMARSYFQQLVDGTDYCHRRGVYHRDLKPENLLVDENGTLKIADFGLSSMKEAHEGTDLLYSAVGTPYYCAPEILNDAVDGYFGEKIDAWSCGIILYLMLTGTLPFTDNEDMPLFVQICKCAVDYPSWMNEDARDLISHLLVLDPTERYNMEQVKKHPWFLIDYAPVAGGGKFAKHKQKNVPGTYPLPQYSWNAAYPKKQLEAVPSNAPCEIELRNLIVEYKGRDLGTVIQAALIGKSLKRISAVVSELEDLDIECVEDLYYLAKAMKSSQAATRWLTENSTLPPVTCIRISGFLFK